MTIECSQENLETVVEKVLELAGENAVVLLHGDLASGKTTLVQAFAKKLGIKEHVTSPTFSLQQQYGEKFFHYDIYNQGSEHFLELGLLEELEKDGLHFIEWGDEKLENLLQSAGIKYLIISIEKISVSTRRYKVENA